MTAAKHLKHLVRARMAATGETYTTARAALRAGEHVVALDDPLVVAAHGRHGQTVVFTPDGHGVISGGQDAVVRVTDVSDGRGLARLAGHTKVVNALALLPDGRLVSASSDRTAIVWDLAAGTEQHRLEGHRDAVTTVAVAADGATVATAGYDGRLRIWDATTWACLAEHRTALRRVSALAFTPDGGHLLEAGQGPEVVVRDAASGEVAAGFTPGGPAVTGLAVAPDGAVVVAAGYDGAVSLWGSGGWEEIRRLQIGAKGGAVAISPSGQLLAVAGPRRLSLYGFAADEPLASTALPLDGVYAVAFSRDGRRVAQTGADGKVRIWRLR